MSLLNLFSTISSQAGGYTPPAYDGKIILIRWWWQSNAVGYADSATFPSEYTAPLSYYNIWTGSQFDKFEYAVNNALPLAGQNTLGIDPILMKQLTVGFPDIPIYVAKYTVGSTGIYNDIGALDWNVANNELYYSSLDYYNNAKAYLLSEFPTKDIIEFDIGIGGEKDASDDMRVSSFQNNLEDIISNRISSTSNDLICIYPKLSVNLVPIRTIDRINGINTALDNVAAQRIRNHTIITDSASFGADGIHYDYSGCTYIANAIYSVMSSYL